MKNKGLNLRIINRDMLKYIAILFMFIGHFQLYTIKELRLLGIPGNIANVLVQLEFMAPPIFFFFIAEGFYYTSSKKKYAIRLLVFAVITQIAYVLCKTMTFDVVKFFTEWNVIMSLLLGLVVLIIWEWEKPLPVRLLLIALCCLVSYVLKMEWAITSQLIILVFHVYRDNPVVRFALYELVMIGYIVITLGGLNANAILIQWEFLVVTLIAIILITFFYNGEKGKHPKFSKYFFYVFYPAHWILIYIVRLIAG